MTVPIILLFDIDGTLLHAHGAGRRALDRAFLEVTGIPNATKNVDFRGMTDPSILSAGFLAAGLEHDSEPAQRILVRYVALLEQELLNRGGALVLPGVVALLDWIEATIPRAAIGLGTGNVQAGAYTKLRSVGLDHRFTFGGFGSDHADRDQILRVGAERGAERLEARLSDCRTLVFGDTHKDVRAALAIGAECVAVGTSGIRIADLETSGAQVAVSTLEDPRIRQHLLEIAVPCR